jgi:D-sedoheptulose 7-phosphate isomerase
MSGLRSPSSEQTSGAIAAEPLDAHFASSIRATRGFFGEHADGIGRVCAELASRFERGGMLFVMGEGAQASDAQHVTVEFVHPVIVGKRALPAVALALDGHGLCSLGGEKDIALAICASGPSQSVLAALRQARRRGLLTLLLAGDAGAVSEADIAFTVPDASPLIVQEVHETLYHVLWELVHVFFHDQLEDELTPFFADVRPPADAQASVLKEVTLSTRLKSEDTCRLRTLVHERFAARMAQAAASMADCFAAGGRLLAFGNGGSATDAQDAAIDCMSPPLEGWRPLPALALPNDIGVVTGVANDVGFEHVFSRQILAFGRPGDIALGISTSGTSRNVIDAMDTAKRRGLLTIGLTGYDGGPMARSASLDYCLVAEGDYIPRIQETHATIWHALLASVQAKLAAASHGARP